MVITTVECGLVDIPPTAPPEETREQSTEPAAAGPQAGSGNGVTDAASTATITDGVGNAHPFVRLADMFGRMRSLWRSTESSMEECETMLRRMAAENPVHVSTPAAVFGEPEATAPTATADEGRPASDTAGSTPSADAAGQQSAQTEPAGSTETHGTSWVPRVCSS